LKAV
jgi:hypothetical protein